MGQLGQLSPAGSVAVGIVVGLASTSIQSLGLTLQRKSHILEEEKGFQVAPRPPYRRRRWQLGMLMFIIANVVGSSIQITTLPLPVLSTLQASGLVFNSICATLILGEPFTRYSLAGTVLVFAGAVLIAVFGAISEPAHNLEQLLALLGRPQFLGWVFVQAVAVVGIYVASHFLPFLLSRWWRWRHRHRPYRAVSFAAFDETSSLLPGPHQHQHHHAPRLRLLRGMAYGAISGILSALTLLVAKSAVELLVRTVVDGKNQFNRAPAWFILLGLLALAVSQLYFLHRGLKLCSTSVLYPFVFCVYNVLAILDGLIYFRQTSRLSTLSAVLIGIGTVILLSGVVCLSWRLHDTDGSGPRPPVAQTPLTPGLGLVPDASTTATDSSDASSVLSVDDDDAHLLPPSAARRGQRRAATMPAKVFANGHSGRTPATAPPRAHFDAAPSSAALLTPGGPAAAAADRRPSPAFSVPSPFGHARRGGPARDSRRDRRRRAQTLAEADAIWGELEEDGRARSPLVSPDPRRRRGSSRDLAPRRLRPFTAQALPRARPAVGAAVDDGHDDHDHGGRATAATTADQADGADADDADDDADANDADAEAARLLAPLARGNTGRSYRERRRWGGAGGSGRRRSGDEPSAGDGAGRRGRSGSQSAIGGWWKMRRWWSRSAERGPDDPEGDDRV